MPLGEAIELWLGALGVGETDLARWGIAWARTLPAVLIIPAFGLRAVTIPVRLAFGLALAVAVAPTVVPVAPTVFWPMALLSEVIAGLPVALSAAAALWAATMAGGLVDDLRGARPPYPLGPLEASSSPVGGLLSLLAVIAFFEMGGAAQVAEVLASADRASAGIIETALRNVVHGITLAVSIAAPIVAVSLIFETLSAVVTRGSDGVALQLLAPARSLFILLAAGLVFEQMAEVIAASTVAWQ